MSKIHFYSSLKKYTPIIICRAHSLQTSFAAEALEKKTRKCGYKDAFLNACGSY